jgi:hypothetical protein
MNSAQATQTAKANGSQAVQAVLQPGSEMRSPQTRDANATPAPVVRSVGYGLPCAKCKTYYKADLTVCPVCKASERVSPVATTLPLAPVLSEQTPDDAALEAEREKFLKEFKSQVYASHTQINAAASFRCSLESKHGEEFQEASVCKDCYDQVHQRLDVIEAALHMDVKEAAQLIYDAVWADPSDPTKTYLNAAHAILGELRNRAGISAVLGPLQPLAD